MIFTLMTVVTAAVAGLSATPATPLAPVTPLASPSLGGTPCPLDAAASSTGATTTPMTTASDSAWTWPLSASGTSSTSGTSSGSGTSGGSGGSGASGPTVLRPFEPPAHRWGPGHRGVDLAGFIGEPVSAAGTGTVLYAGHLVNRDVVVVGHGDLRTSYEPVRPELPVGAHVTVGERIGTLEAGHCATVACLHWGLLTGRAHRTVYYDPLILLGCGHVRLEPAEPTPAE